MSISYSISDQTNYELVGIGTEDPLNSFPAIYGNYDFGYTVTFLSTNTIINVSILTSPLYTTETLLSSNSVRIVKNDDYPIFENELYRFSKFDENYNKSIETYISNEVNSADNNTSVFEWQTPAQETVTGSYSFEITYINNETLLPETEVKVYDHNLIWSQFPGIQILESLMDRSKY